MCRAEVHPRAHEVIANLLRDVAAELAHREHVDPSTVRIGPVDFGEPQDTQATT